MSGNEERRWLTDGAFSWVEVRAVSARVARVTNEGLNRALLSVRTREIGHPV